MNQGELDAKAAEQAAANLGAGAAIIYKDLENYSPASVLPTGSTCGSVVNAYLSGWDTQLHSDQYSAGAYSNPTPAANWAATGNVSPLPDDVWIAQANNQITTWNVGTKYGMTDSMWPDYQRIHQYTGTHSEAWGGTPSFSIDSDIVNAEVFSNTEIPNYAYTPTNIDCPGAIETIPVGINDMSNGALINGPGQMGTVVGFFQSSLGSPTYGFQNTAGSCTTISFPGSSYTEATGINNLGQIVGYFEDSTGAYHGFLLNPGKSPVKIDYTGGGQTYLYGINDAGQIVGWAYNSGTFLYQTFMYYGGQFYPLGFTSNFEYTLGFGINGDATLTGLYYYEPDMEDFELSTLPSGTPPTWTGNVVGLTPGGTANTIAKGINANNEMAGYYYSSECMNTVGQCGFTWSGGTSLDILSYGADANVASGINNLGEVVGPYNDSATQYSHGLIWTHP
jgi:probable HAF family extracellular repeat protein